MQARQNREVVAVYSSRREADQAKQAIQNSGIMGQRVYIDDQVSPSVQVAAMGTTVGGQAGFFMGGFLGGALGVIITIIAVFQMTGDYPHSNLSRLMVIGFTIAGAVFGALVGKGLRDSQPIDQKVKGDPDLARQFRLIVEGNSDELRQARQALNQPPTS
ncbi:hypothetical protein C7293_21350 [filamentous cyanobacterium CCT1]|nr:hypothetical protein C7293_21350 [filamentous cyanobacterium CCT1]PSN78784.1 hypothetical protein C8B47_15085 [filamentous cyanobacterium CCP4]